MQIVNKPKDSARLRRIALAAQGLLQAQPYGSGLAGARQTINHLGYIQIDTISVVERAHHHVLYSRVSNAQPDMLNQLLLAGDIFEYWSHAAAFLPISDFRFSLPYKQAIKSGQTHWYKQPDQTLMAELLARITSDGPLRSRDLESQRRANSPGWWDWKPAKKAPYPKQGTIETDRIYWSTDTNYPSKNSNNWMLASNNNCNDSYIPLEDTGKYQGNLVQFREWTETVWVRKGWFNWKKKVIERRKWVKLDNDDHYNNFECQQDFSQEDPTNPPSGFPDGYPKKDVEGGNTSNIAESDASWRGPYMLYTGNYLNWYHNPDLIPEPKARMEVAKKVIGDLVIQNTSIDFGLMVFNNGANGGRVAKKIEYMDNETRDSFVETNINSLVAKGSTPLCETMYEAYLYLSGLKVKWGDDLDWAVPPRDLSAESGGYYLDPELTCGDQLYIILMTDGEPTSDLSANGLIKQLAGIGSCNN